MRYPGGLSAGNLPQVQCQPSGNGWGIISDEGQAPEAPSLGRRHFHRHWFGHRGPALSLPLHQKSRTSSADSAAVLSTGLLFFLVGVLTGKLAFLNSIIFAFGMIVAFVPEGLLPTLSLSLALAGQRMAGKNAR
jgi:hypothetical protein